MRFLTRQKQNAFRLAVGAIAVLQLANAVHQFEHGAAYVEANCKFCVQLDRADDAAAKAGVAAVPPAAATSLPALVSAGIAAQTPRRGFDSRAPPSL